jgi:hypothetical protein
MRRLLVLAAVALLAACAAKRPPPEPRPLAPAEELVTRARAVERSDPHQARKLYLEVLREYPKEPAAFDARYGMARLRLDPKSPLRSYRLALINFDLLVQRYGKDGGDWLNDVETWRAVLRRLGQAEAKGRRLAQDVDRLREVETERDQLRELDLEIEVGQ